jgi:hypothetical protein
MERAAILITPRAAKGATTKFHPDPRREIVVTFT